MAKQWGIDFEDFNYYAKKIESLSDKETLRQVADKALKKTHNYLTPKIDDAFSKHNRTGRTSKSLRQEDGTEWTSDVGSIDVGYDIKNGGLASIFLMYGTPRIKPDKKLYNLFYGKKIKREVFKIQEEVFNEELEKLLR